MLSSGSAGSTTSGPDVVTFLVEPFRAPVAITCPRAIASDVASVLAPWQPRIVPDTSEAGRVSIVPSARAGCYDVDTPTGAVNGADLRVTLVAVQHGVDTCVAQAVSDWTPLHAGVVVWRDHAIVLPGASCSGKTTLVCALLAAGARYYSDEFAFVDREGLIHAYPRPLVVRDHVGHQRALPVTDAAEPKPKVPAALVAWLYFAPGGELSLAPVSDSEGVLRLLSHTPHALASVRDVPQGFIRLAGQAELRHGTRGESAHAAEALLAYVDGLLG